MSILRKSNKKASSRRQISIKGVKDGVLILPDNQYRLILQASSINFELKSEEEQDAIIEAYQSFLNSLACPVQILTRVREMDIRKYINGFQALAANEEQKVYREQIENYTEFVQNLVTTNKILARNFYIIISYANKDKDEFEMVREQLADSSENIGNGLARLDVQTRQLDSFEVLDLFYNFYSPQAAKRQPVTQQTLQLLSKSYL